MTSSLSPELGQRGWSTQTIGTFTPSSALDAGGARAAGFITVWSHDSECEKNIIPLIFSSLSPHLNGNAALSGAAGASEKEYAMCPSKHRVVRDKQLRSSKHRTGRNKHLSLRRHRVGRETNAPKEANGETA